jgi:dTDP-4-dehydrorhamnose 3,5-epimerase
MTIFQVKAKELKSFPDQRGFFREVIRSTDDLFKDGAFGQWSHSKMQKDVVKAWHYHHLQTDWWYVPVGLIEMVLFDNREESPTYQQLQVIYLGEDNNRSNISCVRIPPGVLHGLKVLSEEAHLFYVTSHTYNPDDEGRFPYNSEVVGYDWGINPIVAENDMRLFVPKATRDKIVLEQINLNSKKVA